MSDDLAVGLVLLLAGIWLFARVWWGALVPQIAKGVL
jgi:hypothetical protein